MPIALYGLPLPALFAFVLAGALGITWLIIAGLRLGMRYFADDDGRALPVRDSIVGACTLLFGLMITFSGAGIWNDAARANLAVQRESDAFENAMVLARAFPPPMRQASQQALQTYMKTVTDIDWPLMRKGAAIDTPGYAESERLLLAEIGTVVGTIRSASHSTIETQYLTQLLEMRGARVARLLAASSGMSAVQWLAVLVAALLAATAIAASNSETRKGQIFATHLFAIAASALIFAVMAHDKPFSGPVAVKPATHTLAVNE